jgi:DNA-directed RNA polymerase specialized sigma subunit
MSKVIAGPKIQYTVEESEIIEQFCANDMSDLKKIVNHIVQKIGGFNGKDYDDAYSFAQYLLFRLVKKYNPNNEKGASFSTFFTNVLKKKLYTVFIRDRNRSCRSNTIKIKKEDKIEYIYNPDVSLEALPPDCVEYMDYIARQRRPLEDKITENSYSSEMNKYISRLSKVQLKILKALAENKTEDEIKQELHIDTDLYKDSIKAIRSDENTKILIKLL